MLAPLYRAITPLVGYVRTCDDLDLDFDLDLGLDLDLDLEIGVAGGEPARLLEQVEGAFDLGPRL